MTRRRSTFAVALTGALALGLTACGGGSEAADGAATIRLGISPFQDTILPIVGQEKGWFAEQGIEVELQTLAWNAIMPAVASGSVDVALNNTTGVVSVAEATDNVVYAYGFNPFTQGSALVGRAGGDLKSMEDLAADGMGEDAARQAAVEQLRGRTIVTTLSTDMGKAIYLALDSVGMTLDDVEIVDMDPDQGLAAFLSGTGDAYLGGVPQRARAVQEGSPVLLAGPDLAPPPINGLVTTDEYLEQNQESILKLANVMHRIFRYCDAETEACGQIVVDRLNQDTGGNLTVEDFVADWQNIELYALNAGEVNDMILDPEGVAYWQTTWDGDNQYLTSTGDLDGPVAAESFFAMQDTWDAYVAEYGDDETDY